MSRTSVADIAEDIPLRPYLGALRLGMEHGASNDFASSFALFIETYTTISNQLLKLSESTKLPLALDPSQRTLGDTEYCYLLFISKNV